MRVRVDACAGAEQVVGVVVARCVGASVLPAFAVSWPQFATSSLCPQPDPTRGRFWRLQWVPDVSSQRESSVRNSPALGFESCRRCERLCGPHEVFRFELSLVRVRTTEMRPLQARTRNLGLTLYIVD